ALSCPWRWISALWRGNGYDGHLARSTERLYDIAFTTLFMSATLLGISFWAFVTFHEPVRTAALIALLGAFITYPLGRFAGNMTRRLAKLHEKQSRFVNRGTVLLFVSPLLLIPIVCIIYAEPLFGAYSPFPLIVVLCFGIA